MVRDLDMRPLRVLGGELFSPAETLPAPEASLRANTQPTL